LAEENVVLVAMGGAARNESQGICTGTIIHYGPEFRVKFWGGFQESGEGPLRKIKGRGGLAAGGLL
jgi:hypothetical protein